jgi:glutamate synthase (ferredoxin)
MQHRGGEGLYDPQWEHDSCGAGFVVHTKGKKSHDIVEKALTVLYNLRHRGACGCEANSGDGAGILVQLPHTFLRKAAAEAGFTLPGAGGYAVGNAFLPRDPVARRGCEQRFEDIAASEGLRVLGWRTVPTRNESLGDIARRSQPFIRQVFVERPSHIADDLAFERKLYVVRRLAAKTIRYSGNPPWQSFYLCTLSGRTLVYKGMLMSEQLAPFYPDLTHPAFESALAVVHSRFSTNTFPSWQRAHPYRMIAHNGEINTLRGNINWMHTREAQLASDVLGGDLQKVLPVILADGSDSAMFDNVLEFLVMAGRPLAHAIMMMIPEPWSQSEEMSDAKRAFYEFHSGLMEPWDGPAAIVFTDGLQVGAVLDRNGLRPARYYVTSDDLVILASEVGVLDVPAERVLQKGRLQPGRMFLVDTREGRIIADEEIKERIAAEQPYRKWLDENILDLAQIPGEPIAEPDHESVRERQRTFGYTFEDERLLLAPMAQNGVEAVGSMGNDAPLAVLSDRPHLLYDYFKQLFAQVTNPPIDAIREEVVTATDTTTGSEGNLLAPGPDSCRHIKIPSPILTNEDMAKIRALDRPGFHTVTLPILFRPENGGEGLREALDALGERAERAIDEGANLLVLSDVGVDRDHAPIPALLAVAGLHHHLIRVRKRTRVGLILESGEPREVHHFALLVGYGAAAVNPYLAFETLGDMIGQGLLKDITHEEAMRRYAKAAMKGVVKVISKMGISTMQSYCGAQIFEAVGLSQEVIDRYFTWTPSRLEGIGLDVIAEEVQRRHDRAYPPRPIPGDRSLDPGGEYQWRENGEHHLFNPVTVHKLQKAVRNEDARAYREYADAVNDQTRRLATLRGLLELRYSPRPLSIDEVEPAEAILRRFKSGAMSYGSISQEAHETLAIAMNRLGGKSNTGEGGEDPARYERLPNGDSKNSAIKQVASARFGVTSLYLTQAREIQIKMAQGAKPGEGGQLPGHKVYPWIAKVRYATPGVGLISPPPHHDIYSIEDLAQLIHDLKNANPEARISVKLVSEVGVGTVAAGVAKAKADVVLISGQDGGTGASPLTSIKHAGLPWELGLAEVHQTLVLNNLRSRIAVETDGQLKTGRDVVIAALLGAEEFGFATAPLVALGCIMMRVCHLNTCPVGVATQDPRLRAKFQGKPEHVEAFMRFVAADARQLMAKMGFRSIDEMVGRSDRLDVRKVDHWKARGLDLSKLLHQPEVGPEVGRFCSVPQNHGLDESLDRQVLVDLCEPAIQRGEKVEATLAIRNTNRVVGTMVGSAVTRRWGAEGLRPDTIRLSFTGSAGQSFGAFIPRGVTLSLEGDANDYLGKGLSGGKIIVCPPAGSQFVAEDNIIIGNVAFYGATSGEAYIGGMAGERFCVRNSGLDAVVEAVGDHGCEYMTGGRVVVLGPTGRNFAAGMSGGVAYVLNGHGDFARRCNHAMVDLAPLCGSDPEAEEEIEAVRGMILRHAEYTKSQRAWRILSDWKAYVPRFVKVLPRDYRRVLEAMKRVRAAGLTGEDATMAAFEENVRDAARVGGN